MSITSDGWTSRATESYVCVTATFIVDWELINCVLQTRTLSESHTGILMGEGRRGLQGEEERGTECVCGVGDRRERV